VEEAGSAISLCIAYNFQKGSHIVQMAPRHGSPSIEEIPADVRRCNRRIRVQDAAFDSGSHHSRGSGDCRYYLRIREAKTKVFVASPAVRGGVPIAGSKHTKFAASILADEVSPSPTKLRPNPFGWV
jgi:hypothetical protein